MLILFRSIDLIRYRSFRNSSFGGSYCALVYVRAVKIPYLFLWMFDAHASRTLRLLLLRKIIEITAKLRRCN
jgi:hypothetical protein